MTVAADRDDASDRLRSRVADFIDRHALLPADVAVLVAVSGGADSVALLALLKELAGDPARRYRLHVAHLDHALRPESPDDAAFVTDLAGRMGLPLIAARVDVGELARSHGESIELAGRQARQQFLQAAAREAGCGFVATGHHADDNVETVLHRIVRGTGLDGLRGIPPVRPMAGGGTLLVRPLLEVSRADLQAYLTARGIAWREDTSNIDTGYTRNRIRNELLPLLREKYNPQAEQAIGRLITTSEWVGQWLDRLAAETLVATLVDSSDRHIRLAVGPLERKEPLAASQVIRLALAKLGAPRRGIGLEHIQRVLQLLEEAGIGKELHLPHDLRVRREPLTLVLSLGPHAQPAPDAEVHELPLGGQVELPDGAMLHAELRDGGTAELREFLRDKAADTEMIDAARLVGPLTVRGRREGDRFWPIGSGGHKTVSDFLTDAKLTDDARRQVWLVCDRLGPVWLVPLRIDERVKITSETRQLAVLRLKAKL